jgi:hypothetical protein
MTTHAPQIPTIEVKFSVGGLEDLIRKLAESGELSRTMFDSMSRSVLLNFPRKASEVKQSGKGKGNSQPQSDRKEGKEKKGDTEKFSALKKLIAVAEVGDVNLVNYQAYKSQANAEKRHQLEDAWKALIDRLTPPPPSEKELKELGKTRDEIMKKFRAAVILKILAQAELTPEEIKQSRAFFPKMQVMNPHTEGKDEIAASGHRPRNSGNGK